MDVYVAHTCQLSASGAQPFPWATECQNGPRSAAWPGDASGLLGVQAGGQGHGVLAQLVEVLLAVHVGGEQLHVVDGARSVEGRLGGRRGEQHLAAGIAGRTRMDDKSE